MTKKQADRFVRGMIPKLLRAAVDNGDGWAFAGLSPQDSHRMTEAMLNLAGRMEYHCPTIEHPGRVTR